MCAIAGIIDLVHNKEICENMLGTMLRRGPDDKGIYESGTCALLHSRLAIIDPAGGRQPMTLDFEGERYTIVYNGELYNTAEIADELAKLGHLFRGHSDTEVLLHAYAQWKDGCLDKLNGIFAFALWQEKEQRLFLARDRMGVKPLFYKLHAGGLLFGSEIKTILEFPTVKAELDTDGIAQVLLLGPGRAPGSGVLRGVQEMEPGWCGYYKDGQLRLRQYWRLTDRPHEDSFIETIEKVRFLVTDAIRRQMVSDVPIGTFLSGGLDSSLISAICAGEMRSRGETLKTFSVDYVDNDLHFVPNKFQPNSDSHYIRIMQETLGTQHHWTVLTPQDLLGALDDATLARDLPGMADVDFSLLAFCKEIRKEVKVALSGECADEIFGGYPWYRDPEVREKAGFPWAQNTAQRAAFLAPWVREKLDPEAFVRAHYEQTIRESDILPENSPQEKRMKEMVNLNLRWFMQPLLDRKDRMSMYSGLEVRVPFCDYRIAQYLYTVPWAYKDYRGHEKGLLRFAMDGVLPETVLWRKKSPYPKTWDPKYLELVTLALEQVLEDSDAPIFTIVDRKALEGLLKDEYPWPWYGQLMKKPQTIAFILQVNKWLKEYKISVI